MNIMYKKTYWKLLRILIAVIGIVTVLPLQAVASEEIPPNSPQAPADVFITYIPFVINPNSQTPPPTNAIIIDHNSIELFDSIPGNYINAAAQLSMLFRHASVGYNISYGLNCLGDKYEPRPSGCDRGIPFEDQIANALYDRDQWLFEFHQPPPSQNPGWWEKIALFIDRVDNLGSGENYTYVAYKHGYVDAYQGSEIDELFFNNDPNDPYLSIEDLEALEARHPARKVIYWTMSIARISYPDSQSFNQQMRNYALANDKVLMDIAAISSHLPDGTPCYSSLGNGVEAICDEYTDEPGGGHLNALGSQRMAKAVWIMMARLAGWNGIP